MLKEITKSEGNDNLMHKQNLEAYSNFYVAMYQSIILSSETAKVRRQQIKVIMVSQNYLGSKHIITKKQQLHQPNDH